MTSQQTKTTKTKYCIVMLDNTGHHEAGSEFYGAEFFLSTHYSGSDPIFGWTPYIQYAHIFKTLESAEDMWHKIKSGELPNFQNKNDFILKCIRTKTVIEYTNIEDHVPSNSKVSKG